MKENLLVTLSLLPQLTPSENLPNYIKTNFRAVTAHFEKGRPEFYQTPVPFEICEAWLRNYLRDRTRNGKKDYEPQTINNFLHALRIALAASDQTLEFDRAQIAIGESWEALRDRMEASIASEAGRKSFRNGWSRFKTWMMSERIDPESFDLAKWKKFRSWLIGRFSRKKTGTTYAHFLMTGLVGVGYSISQKRETRTFCVEVEEQISLIKKFATSRRPIARMGSLAEENLRTALVRPVTFANYEQTLRLYLDFHRQKIEEAGDMTIVINRNDLEDQVLSWIEGGAHSETTFSNRLNQLIQIGCYLWECGQGFFAGKTADEMASHLEEVEPLYGYKARFKASTVRAKRSEKPLPSYATVYWKMSEGIKTDIRSIQKERRKIDALPPSPYKDHKVKNLAIKYANCIAGIMMLLFASRPGDLFGTVTVKDTIDPIDGSVVRSSIRKSDQGTWIINYVATKTDRIDRIAYKNMARPTVHWTWPEEYAGYLEEYLSRYHSFIHSDSSLLLPGDPDLLKDNTEGLIGNRRSTCEEICRRLAEKYLGQHLTENDFRSMLQTFLVYCKQTDCEAFIVAHAAKTGLSKVSRRAYLQMTDDLIEEISREYWEKSFRKLNESKARIDVAHRAKYA